MTRFLHLLLLAAACPAVSLSAPTLHNDRYTVELEDGGAVTLRVAGMSPQRWAPEFTVLWSDADPKCVRIATHPNYAVAPRIAVRWSNPGESLEALNSWVGSPEFQAVTGTKGVVRAEGKGRAWEFRDPEGKVKVHVSGIRALETTRPFTVGAQVVLRAERGAVADGAVRWEFSPQAGFSLAAEMALPAGDGDPALTFTLTPRRAAYYSVAFTGAPSIPLAETVAVPQECDARGHRQFGFVMGEADLHLPRVHVATAAGNVALAADPRECRFRLPSMADSRFGAMLSADNGGLKPVLLAPLLGGAESRMPAGAPWSFTFRCVVRAGEWKETYSHIARAIHGFRDQRDNAGPGSLNGTLERMLDFLVNRRGGNRAMWDPQQKYFDYFNDKTGIYKPFSPLYGLSAAIVADDEEIFRQRARPAVEYALSRRTSVFAPYDNADNKQANSAGREVGAPYIGYAQLATLHALFQNRTPALRALAEAKGPTKGSLADALARWRLTGDRQPLEEAAQLGAKMDAKAGAAGEEELFNLLDLADATGDANTLRAARDAAYDNATKLNLSPAPPDTMVTVDRGGFAPIHLHSFGRHHNQWGYPPPRPVRVPEQTVPAWRIARLGLQSIAYPIEYWMNTHGAMMRVAGLTQDDFLRDLARWGMVGRFGNFPGDNRSQDSLIAERPDAVEAPPWEWNFATVNAGHAWDFAGAVLDFLVSDAFERSRGAIDFPALSAAGSSFRVRIYGAAPGRFFGDENVRLWLPRGLVTSDNRQLDWLAGYGNGQLYLALWNQSFREESASVAIDPALAQCDAGRDAREWREGAPAKALRVSGNRLQVSVAPKGMVAFAIPAEVKPRLQAKLYDPACPPLPAASFTEAAAPFGKVHASLLRAGTGLTTAFVYTEALPEKVISAKLHWRQGEGAWQILADEIYPYEFSPELRDDGGAFEAVLDIEDTEQRLVRSPAIVLPLKAGQQAGPSSPPEIERAGIVNPSTARPTETDTAVVSFPSDFLSYMQAGANEHRFGQRSDGRYYPYSTPQGRRIGWRQPVWDKALYAHGCTPAEAEAELRAALARTRADLTAALAARQPAIDFALLDPRQQETLLDFAHTEGGLGQLKPELLSAVLAGDWERIVHDHLYVRYTGHAPDHTRNKAFAQRWKIP